MKAKRYELRGVAPKPDWWLVRPNEISTYCANVEKGDSRVIAITPNGYPVWSVVYNEFRSDPLEVNFSSATGAREMTYGRQKGEPQTIMLIGGVHGCEIEGTATLFNFMQILETGKDLHGVAMPELAELAKNYKFIIIPCVNMDGRAISPDHRIGGDLDDCRMAGGGYFKDGTPIDWWTMKKYYPIPQEMIGYPGGYPNGNGYNIMHDVGYLRTREAEAVVKLAAEQAPDLAVNFHSQPVYDRNYVAPANLFSLKCIQDTVWELRRESDEMLSEAGFTQDFLPESQNPKGTLFISMNSMIELAAGCPTLTVEFSARLSPSFERILEAGYLFLKTFMLHGLKKPFIDRAHLSD